MAAANTDFTIGSMRTNVLRQAIPLTAAQLINVLYNIVDRMYIGHIPGEGMISLTGLGVTFPIIMIISAFTNLFGMGGAPLSSIARGEGNDEKAETIMGNSFTLLVISGILLTILGLIIKKPVLYAFGASDATFPYADRYITVYLLGSIFVMLGLGMNSYINAQGFPRIGMLSVAIGAVCNLLLDPLFIFVFRMGVMGAALATVISQAVSAVWVMRFLLSKKAVLRLKAKCLKLQAGISLKITALGLTGFTMAVTNSFVSIACNSMLQNFGGDLYVGMMTVIHSIREIITMPVSGLTSGGQPVLGYNYGAKRYDRVKEGVRFMSAAGIGYTVVVWIIVMLLPTLFVRIFNQDASLMTIAPLCMRLYYMGFFLMSFQFIGQTVFVALGKAKQAVFFSLFRKVVVVVPLTLLLPHLFSLGTSGVFLAEPISDLIGGLACYLTMYFTVYKKLGNDAEEA